MKAVIVRETGGPEVLQYTDIRTPVPAAGEVQIRVEAIGVNYVDCYYRSGLYPAPLPLVPGHEAAGVVTAVGESVSELQPGDRVAYANVIGAYAEYVVVPSAQVVRLPDGIHVATAAAVLLQGMTAHYLSHDTYPLKPGATALVHAAAGGVGLLLVQMAKRRGARVFGTVSTEAKRARAIAAGADAVILYSQQDFEKEVMRLTEGKGVNVVYDSVGRTTLDQSLNCVSDLGMLVFFGQSSGPVPPLDPARLMKRGVFFTRPSLGPYNRTRAQLVRRAGALFELIAAGQLQVHIAQRLGLRDAAESHRLLEGRRTSGKVVLVP